MRYRFDRFELNLTQLTITSDGKPIAADARIVTLIGLLIDAYPEHCDRKFLLDQVWPTTMVAHWSLARLVSDTRKLFKEAGHDGPLIQTLHGRGYRLAPELAQQLRLADSPVSPETIPAVRATSWRRPRLRPLFLLIPALILGAAWFSWQYMVESRDRLTIGESADVIGRVLWVDDHPENNLEERRFLESRRIAVYTVTSTEDALKLLALYNYDAVISDMGRGAESLAGLKLLEMIRERNDETPYFMYTILPSEAMKELLGETGGQGVAVTSEELYGFVLPLFDVEYPVD